jgi:hypothetical protein
MPRTRQCKAEADGLPNPDRWTDSSPLRVSEKFCLGFSMACEPGSIFSHQIYPPLFHPGDNAPDCVLHEGKAMNCRAAYEQQEEALWRTFLMFIAMAVLIIRTGLVSRGAIAASPPENAPQRIAPADRDRPSLPSADLHQATLVLLCVAEAAGRLFVMMTRAVWELMKQPLFRPARERPFNAALPCKLRPQRLDTS